LTTTAPETGNRVALLLRFSPATGHREHFHFPTGFFSGIETGITPVALTHGISIPLPLLVLMMLSLLLIFVLPIRFQVMVPFPGPMLHFIFLLQVPAQVPTADSVTNS